MIAWFWPCELLVHVSSVAHRATPHVPTMQAVSCALTVLYVLATPYCGWSSETTSDKLGWWKYLHVATRMSSCLNRVHCWLLVLVRLIVHRALSAPVSHCRWSSVTTFEKLGQTGDLRVPSWSMGPLVAKHWVASLVLGSAPALWVAKSSAILQMGNHLKRTEYDNFADGYPAFWRRGRLQLNLCHLPRRHDRRTDLRVVYDRRTNLKLRPDSRAQSKW